MYYGAGALIIIKQNRYMKLFNELGAADSEHAITFDEVNRHIGFSRGLIFRKMVRRGIFVQCENGRYYIDSQTAQKFKEVRHQRAIFILTVFVIVLFALALCKVIK